MRRLATWMAALLLLATSQLAVAQRGGRNPGSTGGGSYPHETDSDLKDIQNAVAVQATEEQRSQFLSWSQNTEAVKLRLQELRPAIAANDFTNQLNALNAVIEKSNNGYHDFVGSLSEAQHAGLKKQIQKLRKTNDELAKAAAVAIRQLDPANRGAQHAEKLAKVETAIEDLLSAQKEIAIEMGIST